MSTGFAFIEGLAPAIAGRPEEVGGSAVDGTGPA